MDQLPDSVLRFFIQFLHLDKVLPPLPGVDAALTAKLLAIDVAQLEAVREALVQEVQGLAERLLADPEVLRRIDALPIAAGSMIIGVGDSITGESQSWVEILRAMLTLRRPADRISVVNAGASGETTSQMLGRLPAVVALKPDLIICMASTNDARTVGFEQGPSLLTVDETARNITAMRDYAQRHSHAKWIWMTPPTVNEKRIADHWFWQALYTRCSNSDLIAIGDIVRSQAEPVVDLQMDFGSPAPAQLLLDDGLHPSLAGQERIVRCLLNVMVD